MFFIAFASRPGRVNRMAGLGLLLCLAAFFLPAGSLARETRSPVDENIRRLGGKNAGERGAAVVALGNIGAGAKKALPRLLLAADDPDALVRERVAEALARIAPTDKRTIQSLVRRFSDQDPFVAGKAATALASSGEAAVASLVRSLADRNDNARWCAAIALGKIAPGGAQAIPHLTAALKDKNADVRWCAAIALGKHGAAAAAAVPELLDLLRDDDRDVRWAAYASLDRIDREKIDRVPESSAVIEKLEKLTPQFMKELNVPGVAICVIKSNEPAWSACFGVTDAASHAAVNDKTMFEACSMSKPVFACLVLQLAEQGMLDLDKPLGEYLAERFVSADDDYPKQITARMVLTHTSGLPNWRKGGEEREGPLPVLFKPGTKFGYSGEGIYYLQRVVEHITQEPLAAYAKRTLFAPLGLGSMSYVWTEELDPRIATGHDAAGRRLARSRYTHANAAYSLYTTAEEYAKFIAGIMKPGQPGGFSLSGKMTDDMLTRHVRMDSRDVIDRPGRSLGLAAYRGLGWVIDDTISGDIVYHSGSNQTGFTCYSQFDRRQGSGIVIMTNGKGGSELWTRLISAVGDL